MPNLVLRPFQAEDVAGLRHNNYRGLIANAPGTGKTIEVLACIRTDPHKLLPTVVVCPASVVKNWVREAKKWLPPRTRIQAIKGGKTPIRKDAHVVVMSWAMLWPMVDQVLAFGPQMLVVDEAHYAKNLEAQRTQGLQAVAEQTPHLLLLSGTPLINNEDELNVLRSLFQTDEPYMIRRLLDDVAPDIPPKRRTLLNIQIAERDALEYRVADEDFADWLENELRTRMSAGMAQAAAERAVANEALIKIGYLRRLLGRAKVPAAVDWTRRAVLRGEPVVVFAEHQAVLREYMRRLRRARISYVSIVGSTTRKNRERAVDLFQAGRVPVFVGSKAAKEGITLHRARHLLFIERWFTSADEEQAEDRIRRIGQTRATTIWYLHALDTIDERLDQIIRLKRRLVQHSIGNEIVTQQDEDTALELVRRWGKHTNPGERPTPLGLGGDVEPLPLRSETHAFLFSPPRWTRASAVGWCRLVGYRVRQVLPGAGESIRVVCTPMKKFRPGSFYAKPLSKDITAVCGSRR